MRHPRFWIVVMLLVCTAIILQTRGDSDKVPFSEPLSLMPNIIDGRISHDLPIADDILGVLGKGDFLNRLYVQPSSLVQNVSASNSTAQVTPIGLFIGYFPTQRTGQSIHSPQNCLPGAGWTFESRRYVDLQADNGRAFHVGEYVISNAGEKQFVLYWYQSHGRSVANEYAAKVYMIADAIRLNRTDGAIVRIITPILSSESVSDARRRVVRFTAQMATSLPRFIPD